MAPQSFEEAYRRKCIRLKSRTTEVEDANDAARLRLARIKRQVEKLRIERAFLLEQLAKRTSTNVEDSDGSPSPPPTEFRTSRSGLASEADANLSKPKDKPLRIKRGHRKADIDAKSTPGASFSKDPASPGGSDAEAAADKPRASASSPSQDVNDVSKPSKAPKSAFQLYCEEVRPGLETKHAHSDVNIDEELEKAWKDLPESEKDDYEAKLEQLQKAASEKGDAETEADVSSPKKDGDKTPDVKVKDDDEDVEMGNYDTEEQEAQADKDAEKDDDKNGDD